MNEMNELEMQLHSWVPRRPSPNVREALFGEGAPSAAHAHERSNRLSAFRSESESEAVGGQRLLWRTLGRLILIANTIQTQVGRLTFVGFRWLAPAMAAMMLAAALINQRNDTALSSPVRPGPMVAMMMSNQSAAAYLPANFQPEQNRVTPQTFEWTNRSSSTSSIRSLSVLRER